MSQLSVGGEGAGEGSLESRAESAELGVMCHCTHPGKTDPCLNVQITNKRHISS